MTAEEEQNRRPAQFKRENACRLLACSVTIRARTAPNLVEGAQALASGFDTRSEAATIVDRRYYNQLAQFFSLSTVTEISNGSFPEHLEYILTFSGYARLLGRDVTLSEMFEQLYRFLLLNYRCEYVYKNALANKILLAKHSLARSSVLTEFRTGNSKADVAILNGTSSVYEIKTELDSLERLDSQLASYFGVFDRVYVVTHESHVAKLTPILTESVGVILLTNRYALRTVREAQSNKHLVDSSSIFDCLRQGEYFEILRAEFGYVPQVPNTRIYAESKKLFSTLSPTVAHDAMVRVLRKSRSHSLLGHTVNAIPHCLRLAYLAAKLTLKQRESFMSALKRRMVLRSSN